MKRRLAIALQVLLLALVAWAVWRRVAPELAGVRAADFARWRPAIGMLAAATAGLTLLHLLHAFLWRRVLVDVGAPPPDARTTVRVYFVAGLARFIPGSIWKFPGFAVLAHQAGIPALAASAAGVIAEVAFLGTGVLFLALTLPGMTGAPELLLAAIAFAVLIAVAFVFSASGAGARLRATVTRRAPARIQPALELAGRIRPGHAVVWVVAYGLSWLLLGASFALFVAAFVPGALAHWRELGGIMAAAFLGGYIVLLAPAGLGVREGIMVLLLSRFMPAPAAALVALAQRLWFFVAELLALSTFTVLPRRRGSHEDGAPGGDRKLTEVL